MADRRVADWIREHVLGVPLSYDEAEARAKLKVDPPGWRKLCRNRLVLGALRYESLGKGVGFDAIGSAIERLREYQRTGNREHLVDAANLCRVEWVEPRHPHSVWAPAPVDQAIHAKEVERWCHTCGHRDVPGHEDPCDTCINHSNWGPR